VTESLSVLMPVYNERESLAPAFAAVWDYLTAGGYRFEVILVDDASTDGSDIIIGDIVRRYPGVRTLRHHHNCGPCSGLKTGPALATGDWLLLLPVDLAIPLTDIDTLWRARTEGDIIAGYIADRRARPFREQLRSELYSHLVRGLFGLAVRQINYVSLYRTAVLRGLPLSTSGVALHAEILVRAARAGYAIREVGLGFQSRRTGTASGGKAAVIAKTAIELVTLWRRVTTW